ncbi:MAG: DUF1178 family protein [Sphingomonas sp.]|uniref:DUF1178 family protein n=1 Tax=Sphingomonas sp. TaxID=28214 RepID=UPI0012021FD3|nr:DUF1178 family protein [Sphingomonas sp.]THD36804.1 MAG: DUF1178 family protein [Sphingomonas sp.]
MIVFDLKCGKSHVFEAWFGSSADYEDQQARGLVDCPICGDRSIEKAVMAPAVGAKSNRQADVSPAAMKAAMAALAAAQSKALEGSQWVGTAFAGRARAMHAGEEDHAPIHGQATIAEAKALAEDGVPVAPLPLPVVPPDACN